MKTLGFALLQIRNLIDGAMLAADKGRPGDQQKALQLTTISVLFAASCCSVDDCAQVSTCVTRCAERIQCYVYYSMIRHVVW